MILLLDNFDSFTFNLADYFNQLRVIPDIQRCDIEPSEIIKKDYKAMVLSPGPGRPEDSGNLMRLIDYYHDKIPILGICLGHQALATYFGSNLHNAKQPMHGKISEMVCKNDELFHNIPSKIKVVRYHSLIVSNLPSDLKAIAHTGDGEIMAIRHKTLPIYGLQYHPEAILTEYGKEILNNWIFLSKIMD